MRIHTKHGLNPCIPLCYLCQQPKNGITFLGAAYNGEAPRNLTLDKEPCDQCKEFMKQGIILISVKNGEAGDNPYRTGRFCVIKEEAARRIFNDERFLKTRAAFIEDEAWDMIGLPTNSVD